MTIKIEKEKLDEVFSNLKVIKDLCSIYENMDEIMYRKFLSEFVAILCVLNTLGLDDEWYKWQIEHENEE